MNYLFKDEDGKLLQPRDQHSMWLFGKLEKDLDEPQLMDLEAYIDDLKHPEWRDIYLLGEKTKFSISNFGIIVNKETGQTKKCFKDKDGYLLCNINNSSVNKHCMVHRLVASAFIPNTENKPQVNHMNTNKECNWVGNLEWTTAKENIKHAMEMGLEKYLGLKGEANNKNVYKESQIVQVCELLQNPKLTPRYISKVTGVSPKAIFHIRKGNIWTHISKNYTFPDRDFSHGVNHMNAKYTEEQIREICKRLEKGIAPGVIAKELGVHSMLVQQIRKGTAWKHISKEYKFPKIDYTHGEQKVQSKHTNETIKKVCEFLMNPYLTYEDISKETGVHKDTVFRIAKGKQWVEISKNYEFPERSRMKTKIILDTYDSGKKTAPEIYDAMKNVFGMAGRYHSLNQINDILNRYHRK